MAYDLSTHPSIAPGALSAELTGARPPLVVDVRSQGEYDAGHVPGALHVDFWTSGSEADRIAQLAGDRPIVVTCEHGPRACVAGSLLALEGVEVEYLAGHMSAWKRAGLPTTRE
ncbi:MAG: rhodanese-like domain-containing protein [Planctomycetes bacterium]|nr:rhodanese-like domain-containing protein [Planctomycetota bacterium]